MYSHVFFACSLKGHCSWYLFKPREKKTSCGAAIWSTRSFSFSVGNLGRSWDLPMADSTIDEIAQLLDQCPMSSQRWLWRWKTRHNFKATPKKHVAEKRETIGMLDEGILGVSRYLHVCRRYAISIIYVYPGYSMYWYCGLHTNIEAYLPSNVFMLFMVQGTRLVARSLVTHLQSCKQ